jgi:adenylate kinase family enzyme
MVLVGPPGSGKTTTLIKRLGQTLDLTWLDEEDELRVQEGRPSPLNAQTRVSSPVLKL